MDPRGEFVSILLLPPPICPDLIIWRHLITGCAPALVSHSRPWTKSFPCVPPLATLPQQMMGVSGCSFSTCFKASENCSFPRAVKL